MRGMRRPGRAWLSHRAALAWLGFCHGNGFVDFLPTGSPYWGELVGFRMLVTTYTGPVVFALFLPLANTSHMTSAVSSNCREKSIFSSIS